MADDQLRPVEFEGLRFPIWAVVHTGPTLPPDPTAVTTHHLIGEGGERDVPLFREEGYARDYAARNRLPDCGPVPIRTPRDLLTLLEDFHAKGDFDVRFDDVYGPTPGTICYPGGELIRFVRAQFPDA